MMGGRKKESTEYADVVDAEKSDASALIDRRNNVVRPVFSRLEVYERIEGGYNSAQGRSMSLQLTKQRHFSQDSTYRIVRISVVFYVVP
ncbi:hypothetical protein V1477_000641 [Vespula maculifrons]|uniref:Uncharacterized protein n=1 Tax=Vespula maculifrons TaxID=7453 RepID=A0ABD2D271_VESMC